MSTFNAPSKRKEAVREALNVQVASADVVQGLVIVHDRDICVFQQGVHTKHCVVWLHNRCGHLRARPHSEGDLGLLPIVYREAFKHQAAQARARASSYGIEDHEPLKPSTVVSKLSDAIQHKVDNLFANGIVTAGKVVCCVFLS